MSTLNDVLGFAKSQIKNDQAQIPNAARSAQTNVSNTTKSSLDGAVSNAIGSTLGKATGAAASAVGAGVKDLNGAIGQAAKGDFSGAAQTLLKGPSDVAGVLSQAFGLSSGDTLAAPFNPFSAGVGTSGMTINSFKSGGDFQAYSSPGGAAGGNSLGGALARTDPMLTFCWYAEMPIVTPINGQPTELPWYYVEEAQPPFRNIDMRSVFREGKMNHYPAAYSLDSLRLAIYADSSNVAMTYLQAWSGAILAPTTSQTAAQQAGGYGRPYGPNGYKKSIKLYLVNVAKQLLMTLEYTDCWPMTVDAYSLNSGSSDRIVNHVTFATGDVFITLAPLAAPNSLDVNPRSRH